MNILLLLSSRMQSQKVTRTQTHHYINVETSVDRGRPVASAQIKVPLYSRVQPTTRIFPLFVVRFDPRFNPL